MALTGIRGNQGFGLLTVRLKPWEERSAEQSARALEQRASRLFRQRKNAKIFVNLPPVVRGLGSAGGLNFVIKDSNGQGYDKLVAAAEQFTTLAAQEARLRSVRVNNQDPRSQVVVDVDDRKALAYSINLNDINAVLTNALGGTYVNDFIHNGRVKRVYLQADAPFRMQPQNIGEWKVRNQNGEMIPLSAFSSVRWNVAPPQPSASAAAWRWKCRLRQARG